MKNQLVFIANVDSENIKTEDGGQAKIVTLCPESMDGEQNNGVFVRLHSWCEGGEDHPELDALIKPGKSYIIHIEQLE